MNPFRKWLFLSIFLILARGSEAQNPGVAGAAPSMEAGIGYSYVSVDVPSQNLIAMNGVDESFTADFRRRFGIRFDLCYDRASNVFDTNRHADLLTYMAGPVFYPVRQRRFSVYTHLLVGGARQTGVNFTTDGGVATGWVNRFAWAGGVGVQYRLTPAFSVRLGGDYLRTSFFNANLAYEAQNNVRTAGSIVYTFGGRHQ
jgi:opacity protein-like surface antigen